MQKKAFLVLFFFYIAYATFGSCMERQLVAEQYIKEHKEDAIKEMLAYNIPASITLAQGMFESSFGTSDLAKYANNHFGIKCHKEWEGPVFIKDDETKNECFRKYETVLDSYTDHSVFLKSRPRYTYLFNYNNTDYLSWAKGLQESGYATDPKYAKRLLALIEAFHLYKYDVLNQRFSSTKILVNTTAVNSEIEIKNLNRKNLQEKEIYFYGTNKFVVVEQGNSLETIAKETGLSCRQLSKYNDIPVSQPLAVGDILFLSNKKKITNEQYYIARKGDTMRSISQAYCLKLKLLYKRNRMKVGEEPIPGQKIYLNSSK